MHQRRLLRGLLQARVLYAAVLSAAVCAGCGKDGEVETFSVSGTVTSGGQPVEEGSISFYDPKTGHARQAELETDGSYEVDLPAGTYRVAIEPPFVEVSAPETEPDLVYKDMPSVPEQYRTASSSGLEAQVDSDAESVDFDLTPAAP